MGALSHSCCCLRLAELFWCSFHKSFYQQQQHLPFYSPHTVASWPVAIRCVMRVLCKPPIEFTWTLFSVSRSFLNLIWDDRQTEFLSIFRYFLYLYLVIVPFLKTLPLGCQFKSRCHKPWIKSRRKLRLFPPMPLRCCPGTQRWQSLHKVVRFWHFIKVGMCRKTELCRNWR